MNFKLPTIDFTKIFPVILKAIKKIASWHFKQILMRDKNLNKTRIWHIKKRKDKL